MFAPIIEGDAAYLLSQHSRDAQVGLNCLDTGDLSVRWHERGDPPFDWGPFLMVNGRIFTFSGKGLLRMIEADPGSYVEMARAELPAEGRIFAHMAYSRGRLVLRSQKHTVCVDLRAEARMQTGDTR
jgi:hypothetical protein